MNLTKYFLFATIVISIAQSSPARAQEEPYRYTDAAVNNVGAMVVGGSLNTLINNRGIPRPTVQDNFSLSAREQDALRYHLESISRLEERFGTRLSIEVRNSSGELIQGLNSRMSASELRAYLAGTGNSFDQLQIRVLSRPHWFVRGFWRIPSAVATYNSIFLGINLASAYVDGNDMCGRVGQVRCEPTGNLKYLVTGRMREEGSGPVIRNSGAPAN